MFARVIQFTTPIEKIDEGNEIMENHSKPTVSSQPGFQGGYWLVDRASGRSMVITLWETQEALDETEAVSARLREEGAEFGMTMESVTTYEVVTKS